MGILKIYQGKSKPAKKKPGWQKTETEYNAWLAKTKSSTLFGTKPKPVTVTKRIDPIVRGPVIDPNRLCRPPSLKSFGGSGTKPVPRPDIQYKHEPELLARELKARERKFAVAPAYNKGAAQYVSDEELQDQLLGAKRRP